MSLALALSSISMSSQNVASSLLAKGYRNTMGGSTRVMSRLRASASSRVNTVSVDVRFRRFVVDASMMRCLPTKSLRLASSTRLPPFSALGSD